MTLLIDRLQMILGRIWRHCKRDPIVVVLLLYVDILIHACSETHMVSNLPLIIQNSRLRDSMVLVYRILTTFELIGGALLLLINSLGRIECLSNHEDSFVVFYGTSSII